MMQTFTSIFDKNQFLQRFFKSLIQIGKPILKLLVKINWNVG